MCMKKYFRYGDQVVIVGTGAERIDGQQGKIIGVASRHIVDCYIVDLGEPKYWAENFSAIVLTESCLDLVEYARLKPSTTIEGI
jgi:hypothetical protein